MDKTAVKSKHTLEEGPGTSYGFHDMENLGNMNKLWKTNDLDWIEMVKGGVQDTSTILKI